MKKKIITTFCAVALFAIAANSQVSLVLRGGLNYMNIVGDDAAGDKLNSVVVPRFNFGALVNIPVAVDFAVQSGLVFETKGAKITTLNQGVTRVQNTHLSYLQIPVNLLYNPVLGKGRLLLGFGPYLAYGVGGKNQVEGNTSDEKVVWKNKVSVSDPTNTVYFKPFEMGANFLFGYEFSNKIQIQFNAQLGLTEINPVDDRVAIDKSSIKNSGFGISLGYRI